MTPAVRQVLLGGGIPSNPEIITLGDSRTALNLTPTISASNYILGGAGTGYMQWLLALCGQRFYYPNDGNFGVSGALVSGATGMATKALDDATWAVNNLGFYNVLTHPAKTVIILGGTNDFGGGVTLAVAQAAMTNILARLRSARKRVVIFNELPRGIDDSGASSNALSAGNMANMKAYSDWILTLNAPPYVYVVDTWSALVDGASGTNYTNIQGTLYDGLHPNFYGAYLIANKAKTTLNLIFPSVDYARLATSDSDTYNASTNPFGSLSGHPLLPKTLTAGSKTVVNGSTINGTVCTSCNVTNNSAAGPLTFTCSQDTNGDGWDQQNISWTGTVNNTGSGSMTFSFGTTATNLANITAGDLIQGAALLGFDPSTFANVTDIRLFLNLVGSTNHTAVQTQSWNGGTSTTANWGSIPAIRAPFVTPILDTGKAGGTLSNFTLQVSIQFKQNSAVTGSISISRMALRKIVPPHYTA